jgi:hypothetical protein
MPAPPIAIGDRPVVGKDLLLLQQWLGLDVAELTAALGINITRWTELTERHPDEPLDDPALALLVWALFTYPEHSYLPRYPDPQETYAVYQQVTGELPSASSRKLLATKRAFGLLLGREETSGFRWLSPGSGPKATRPQTRRLMRMFTDILKDRGAEALQQWLRRVSIEAASRGIADLWESGSWKSAKQQQKPGSKNKKK